nr:hypothetical protein [uncultured Bacteroides sp.]
MKKNRFYIALGVVLLGFTACTDEEDTSPSYADQNLFAPSEGDHSEMAEFKRNFHKETGAYLLFNDTLSKEQNGTDAYGNPIWNTELVDLTYPVIGESTSYRYTYKYVEKFENRKLVANLIKEKLAVRLGKAVPYSFLIVDSITTWRNNNGMWEIVPTYLSGVTPHPTQVLGTRCYAISTSGDTGYEDEDYFVSIFKQIVLNKLQRLSADKFSLFYSYGENYYGVDKLDLDFPREVNDSLARSLGFWKDYNSYYFAFQQYDLEDFSNAVCTYSPSEVNEMMAEYPLVIEKFNVLREIIKSMGIKVKD